MYRKKIKITWITPSSKYPINTFYIILKNERDEHLNISLTHELMDEPFTSTVLFPVTTSSKQNYDGLNVLTMQHFGEPQTGTWSIRVYDTLTESYLSGSEFDIGLEFFMHDESITI